MQRHTPITHRNWFLFLYFPLLQLGTSSILQAQDFEFERIPNELGLLQNLMDRKNETFQRFFPSNHADPVIIENHLGISDREISSFSNLHLGSRSQLRRKPIETL